MIKQIVMAAILSISMTACSGTKKMTMKDTDGNKGLTSENTDGNQEEHTSEMGNADSTIATGNPVGGLAAQTNGSSGAMNNVLAQGRNSSLAMDYDQMFADLDMTDDQISRFRSAMEDFQEKQVNMPNGKMLGTIESERSRQLQEILSSEQFEKYEKWQQDNE